MHSILLPLTCLFLLNFWGCDQPSEVATTEVSPAGKTEGRVVTTGCRRCHQPMQLDSEHDLLCTTCHRGDPLGQDMEMAHQGVIRQPAHPDHLEDTCGQCHTDKARGITTSLHFTLANKVNLVRDHFGATTPLTSLTEIPLNQATVTPLDLADDLLRRRCLRCHLHDQGDNYPLVSHGTGCAACHLPFENGALVNHQFALPTDRQCLSCHHGNYVGSDYYGGFQMDFNWEYRTPYATRAIYSRPWGVEQYDLAPDLHQQSGMTCTDCHTTGFHGQPPPVKLSCLDCHEPGNESRIRLLGLHLDTTTRVLRLHNGDEREVPQLEHPAHKKFADQVACQVCHAQWSFNDAPTYLMRSASEDIDHWARLTVQGSSEVEILLENNLYSDDDDLEPVMRDSLSKTTLPGVWYKGFGQRRWEQLLIRRDTDGIIKVFRPILDLHLSAVTQDNTVLFDTLAGTGPTELPYTPHTTGHAGMFFMDRFRHLVTTPAKTP